jgi:hypothetical protein
MKKPLNKFALLLWIAAAVVAVINIVQICYALEALKLMAQQANEHFFVVRSFFNAISGTITPVVTLIGIGALIELADQIRWNTRPQK